VLAVALLLAGCAALGRAALPPVESGAPGTPRPLCAEAAGRLVSMTIDSQVYGRRVAVSVYQPPCYAAAAARLPVVYLLHGGNADETQWPDLNVAPAADALIARGAAPFVVVMPGGDYGSGVDYAAFVLGDLLPQAERQLHIRADGAGRAIGGISLGGYWALEIAFRHPELFAAAGGHSAVVDRRQPDDPLSLARSAGGLQRLAVRLDVGRADALRGGAERLARALEQRSVAVTLHVAPGAHDRAYWRAHTPEYLDFYRTAITG
jgi:enterochelin esterase-like enzyme